MDGKLVLLASAKSAQLGQSSLLRISLLPLLRKSQLIEFSTGTCLGPQRRRRSIAQNLFLSLLALPTISLLAAIAAFFPHGPSRHQWYSQR